MFVGLRFGSSSFFGIAAAAATIALLAASPGQATEGCFRGINLSGAEFGEPPGTAGKDYVYPSNETIDYFASKGFTSVRLPFLWERLQPQLGAELDPAELARLVAAVGRLRERGLRIVLDPHNYARYRGDPIGSAAVPAATFADFWGRLARVFANQPDVSFGLMNEPHDISAGQWLEGANAAIAGIREAGAGNLVLVPGTAWTGAHSWQTSSAAGANGDVMLGVIDPSDHYAYEVHQYFPLSTSPEQVRVVIAAPMRSRPSRRSRSGCAITTSAAISASSACRRTRPASGPSPTWCASSKAIAISGSAGPTGLRVTGGRRPRR
jgi:Cellulase (EC 3.2.1.4). Glycosyl Hydrolase family 5.